MNIVFFIGALIIPLLLCIFAFAIGSSDSWLFQIWPAVLVSLLATGAFSAGRSDNIFSSTKVTSNYRKILVFSLAVACGLFNLLAFVFAGQWLSGYWLAFIYGLSVIAAAATAGYYYGPLFNLLSNRWPHIKHGNRLE